jgi:hypothetical protein
MDKLVLIIADMLQSALAWEEEHGVPEQKSSKTLPKNTLTNHPKVSKVERSETINEDKSDEHEVHNQK